MLADFATVEAKSRRLVVRDGVRSNPFKQKVDCIFNVWVPTAWKRPTGVVVIRTFSAIPTNAHRLRSLTTPETYLVVIQPAEGGAELPIWEQLQNHVTLVHNDHFAADGLRVEIRPIDAKNQVCFNDVPPGRYVLVGWPSRFGPGGRSTPFADIERSKPLAIDVKSEQTVEIKLPEK